MNARQAEISPRDLGLAAADGARTFIEATLTRGIYTPICDALLPGAVKLVALKPTTAESEFA